MSDNPPEFLKLLTDVSRQIESTPDGLMDFRNICRDLGHVRAFDLDKTRAATIIKKLRHRMIIHPGQYEKFVEILEIIRRDDVIRMLPGYQDYGSNCADNNNTTHIPKVIPNPPDISTALISPCSQPSTADGTSGRVTDIELLNLSDRILPDMVRRLGIFLRIPVPEIEMKIDPRLGLGGAAYRLLVLWRENVPERDQRTELLRALREADMSDLASECFGNGKHSSREITGPLSTSSSISDIHLSRLAGKIGEGWSQFGIRHLGMSKVDIDRFEANQSNMEDRIFKMMYEWRRRNHEDATIGKLLGLMEKSEHISPDTYSFILDEIQTVRE